MENERKPRVLYLLKILLEYSDPDHPLTTSEILRLLMEKYGISAHRTTIPKDIEDLEEFGIDIVTISSSQKKYFIASRHFEVPELKLLIDAVESSKFITASKSHELISKLGYLVSESQGKELKRNLFVANRIKPNNEQIYAIVDVINDAINAGSKISFQYYEYTAAKKKALKHGGMKYCFSPYSLVWNGDYYYVLGYSDKHGKIVQFRVDRIADTPVILHVAAVPAPNDFDVAEYAKRVYQMYDGENAIVELRCENALMQTIIDRFGEDVMTVAYDMTSFKATVEVSVSPTFFGWVFGFCGRVQILTPQSVQEEFARMLGEFQIE